VAVCLKLLSRWLTVQGTRAKGLRRSIGLIFVRHFEVIVVHDGGENVVTAVSSALELGKRDTRLQRQRVVDSCRGGRTLCTGRRLLNCGIVGCKRCSRRSTVAVAVQEASVRGGSIARICPLRDCVSSRYSDGYLKTKNVAVSQDPWRGCRAVVGSSRWCETARQSSSGKEIECCKHVKFSGSSITPGLVTRRMSWRANAALPRTEAYETYSL
jgi:hypothetical protein